MYVDSLTLTLLLVVLVIIVNIAVSYLRVPSIADAAEQREKLEYAIKALRLNKMLALLNIPLEHYLQTVPLAEVAHNVQNCRACTELQACDRCLAKGVPAKDMRFCANHGSLLQSQETYQLSR